jgi:hypothetical protein
VLEIREAQLQLLAKSAFLQNLHAFLLDKTQHNGLLKTLGNKAACLNLWKAASHHIEGLDEQAAAVILAYALACNAADSEPNLLGSRVKMALEDREMAMKSRLESWGMLRFSDFAT